MGFYLKITEKDFPRKQVMKQDRRQKSAMESIGFVYNSVNWIQRFQELKQYKAKESQCIFPWNSSENKQLRTRVKNGSAHFRLFH